MTSCLDMLIFGVQCAPLNSQSTLDQETIIFSILTIEDPYTTGLPCSQRADRETITSGCEWDETIPGPQLTWVPSCYILSSAQVLK